MESEGSKTLVVVRRPKVASRLEREARTARLLCLSANLAVAVAGACGHTHGSAPAIVGHKGYPADRPPTATATATTTATAQASSAPGSASAAAQPSSVAPGAPGSAPAAAQPPSASPGAPPRSPPASEAPRPSPASSQRTYEPPLPLASAGPRFTVRGVDRSDVLNVRAAPGPQSAVIGQIPPETTGILGTGPRRRVGPGLWREVRYGELQGWVNDRFLVEERDADSPSSSDSGRPAGP